MSSRFVVRVGAYLLIKAKPVTEERTYTGCENGHEYWSTRFCPECGQPFENQKRVVTRLAQLEDLLTEGKYEDAFSTPNGWYTENGIVALNNHYKDCEVEIPEYENTCEEITPETMTEMKDKFTQSYRDVIEVLKQRAESVEVKFGVVGYNS